MGGGYICQHSDVPTIIDCLVDHDCPKEIVQDLERILTVRCPAKLVADDTRKNFLEYWKYGNHLSIASNMDKVMKTMNKEDKNSFLMILPAILGRLIPDIRYTPQGLVIKPGENDRLIWDGSHLIFYYSVCVNMLMDQALEPRLMYGTSWDRHLRRIWNLRITYPDEEILLMDDDVKGAFRHPKYHPDIAAIFAFIILSKLFIPTGGTFGSTTSPANFEPFARARTFLAEKYSREFDLVEKHWDILQSVQFSALPDENVTYVQAVADEFNKGVLSAEGKTQTQYNMFVDDSLFAEIRKFMLVAIAGSIVKRGSPGSPPSVLGVSLSVLCSPYFLVDMLL